MDVVFAVLPFADVDRPAIGVSLLKAEIERLGFSASIRYLNIRLAEIIGNPLYLKISETLASESLVGEWFFADLLFKNQLPHEQEYVSKVLNRFAPPDMIGEILQARRVRQEFLDYCVDQIKAENARIVGFTTTFHQTCICLAIAKRLKEMPGAPVIVFGGANCEGEMGLQMLQSFEWIDYVCTREGDVAFPALVEKLLREPDAPLPSGILQQGISKEVTYPDLVRNLDDLPLPDYKDYFAAFGASPLSENIKAELVIETSRGCWWGAKSHCTFCGLNGDTMSFRSKSPERAFDEMRELSETYNVKKLNCVDNILDLRYVPALFTKLAESGLNLELFYEIKSNIRYEQVAALSRGGVKAVQPGIESLSNEILRRMRKGCTGLQNIQLLRWCREKDIYVAWNLLAGFPGEAADEYDRMAQLLPLLEHLQPPTSCFPIRLDRFSPLYTRAAEFGLERIRPNPAYYYVFPLGRRDLARLAYFFDFDYPDRRNPQNYLGNVKRAVNDWLGIWHVEPDARARLDAEWTDDGAVEITDTRPCAASGEHKLNGLAAQIYFECDAAQSFKSLLRRINAEEIEIQTVLDDLQKRKLMTEMEGQYLSLAVWRKRPAPEIATENEYANKQSVPTAPARSLPHLIRAA